jgi:hypothetical protein
MKSKPEVDKAILTTVKTHMRLDKADDMFSELSKLGGVAFKYAMTRIKRIVKNQRA